MIKTNHENLRNPRDNYKNNENLEIPNENNENHESLRNFCEDYENLEKLIEIDLRITQVMKII